MVKTSVLGLFVDPRGNAPVVLLKEADGDRTLPIWIGENEAQAVALELAGEKYQFHRPLTHDLVKSVLDKLDAQITRVVVSELKELGGRMTYYAELFLSSKGGIIKIDARPSDSIILALKIKLPIYVAEGVMDASTGEASEEDRAQRLRDRLQRIDPENFGRFSFGG